MPQAPKGKPATRRRSGFAPGPFTLAPLLFGSGACALCYQTVWFREFRLIFGGSTPATAAVLAVFIGGLGAGSLILGKKADAHPRPLRFYAWLETRIAIAAALTSPLLWFVGRLYVGFGGTERLGWAGGTILRLLLGAVVLGVPTFLMGGTLPAAARGIETEGDRRRTGIGVLYGLNTLGAVVGTLAATFFMLEALGNRATLWVAAAVNLVVAGAARIVAMFEEEREPEGAAAATAKATESGSESTPAHGALPAPTPAPAAPEIGAAGAGEIPTWFVPAAAFAVGFAFFLMELVWYRMLGALVGATVYTLGLILAVALLGIGVGGLFYFLWGRLIPATLPAFAFTCLLEAAAVAYPYYLGDEVAVKSILWRPDKLKDFVELAQAWAKVTGLVVFPAAFVAGLQFPLLIALMGRGRKDVGRQTGLAYAWNTGGAIFGSLAGGFGMMPLLSAPGCWRAVAALLALCGLGAILISARRRMRFVALVPALAAAVLVARMLAATGPTPAWRHSSIGAYRVAKSAVKTPNDVRDFVNKYRRAVRWEADGREASVGLDQETGYAFFVNGKPDGHVREDAPTQVMGPMLGALLHGKVKTAMVIGLGTGSSAGWLGSIPAIQRVDVAEIEPVIKQVARKCSRANRNVLDNPKVHVIIGDAREILLTSERKYDLVFSEPSNPSRAGIASLFTREYYAAIADRLAEDGVFLQWLQGYEVDTRTVYGVYATIARVFPQIETWELAQNDLLLVATRQPIVHDSDELRRRIAAEPFRSAIAWTYRASTLEEVLSHHLAQPGYARMIAGQEGDRVNTDDRNFAEFGFSHLAGDQVTFADDEMQKAARNRGEDRPALSGLPPDWDLVGSALRTFRVERWSGTAAHPEPAGLGAVAVRAEQLANEGNESARPLIEQVAIYQPIEGEALMGRLRFNQKNHAEAASWLASALTAYRDDPWPSKLLMERALDLAIRIASADPTQAPRLIQAVSKPFALRVNNRKRMDVQLAMAKLLAPGAACRQAIEEYEPFPAWTADFLRYRKLCYETVKHPRARQAAADLDGFEKGTPP